MNDLAHLLILEVIKCTTGVCWVSTRERGSNARTRDMLGDVGTIL